MYLDQAIEEMKSVFKDLPYGLDHTLRVLSYAELIMNGEGIDGPTREVVSLAAVLHDVGSIEALLRHGSMEAQYQEVEGGRVAQEIMARIGVPGETAQRVRHIVCHHHTPAKIDGLDFQILWEADFLEFLLFGDKKDDPALLASKVAENFKTDTGRNLACDLLGLNE